MSYELWITSYEFKAGKHELKFKSASSNSRVTNLNSHVTSSNQKQQNREFKCVPTWGLTPPPPLHSWMHFGWPPHSPWVAYVLKLIAPFLTKITHKGIRISYSLFTINGSVGWNKHSGEQH